MKHLKNMKTFVEYLNNWFSMYDKKLIQYPVKTVRDAHEIFLELDHELSPENLHCDGEISLVEANKKYWKLHKLGIQLIRKGFKPASKWSEFTYYKRVGGKVFNIHTKELV